MLAQETGYFGIRKSSWLCSDIDFGKANPQCSRGTKTARSSSDERAVFAFSICFCYRSVLIFVKIEALQTLYTGAEDCKTDIKFLF